MLAHALGGVAGERLGHHGIDAASTRRLAVAMNSASNYASVNRSLLAELVRLRMREVFGPDVEVPLLFDVRHNIVLEENGSFVHRKGATPAHRNQPVLIPGSMGHPSFLMVGLGNERYPSSAAPGARRPGTRCATANAMATTSG